MTQLLSRYLVRSPRYILQAHENSLVRIAGPQQTPWEEGTEIKNVSLSGISFTAPVDLCPLIGETIKIQFQVPGGVQMACFGLVLRLDTIGNSSILVSVKFQKLEMAHRVILAQGLALKLREQQMKKIAVRQKSVGLWKPILFLILAGAAFFGALQAGKISENTVYQKFQSWIN